MFVTVIVMQYFSVSIGNSKWGNNTDDKYGRPNLMTVLRK